MSNCSLMEVKLLSLISKWLVLDTALLGDLIGAYEGGIWAVGIVLTLTMIGIFSPAGAIIGMMVGLISLFALGLFTPLTIGFVVIVGALGIYIATKVRK